MGKKKGGEKWRVFRLLSSFDGITGNPMRDPENRIESRLPELER